ncbi:MRPL35 54S ribosomal protein L35 [Candida maltosa Xu316]
MLRTTISRQFQRSQSSLSKGVWSDFTKRAPTLVVQQEEIRKGILGKIPSEGPGSFENPAIKQSYNTPIAIDETFEEAYKILEEEASEHYTKIDSYEKLLQENKEVKNPERVSKLIQKSKIKAELKNPEVLFNVEYGPIDQIDFSQPIYRVLMKEKWKNYDLMLTMQRLEQLHVIPDTLPTLAPEVDVKVKFPHNTEEEFEGWVEPGTVLPCFAVEKPPVIKIQEFEEVKGYNLYTVLVVNPDTPDLEANTYSTTLHYALANVPLNNVDNTIDVQKLLNEDVTVLQDYLPLTPEKNLGNQRACLWVFRQQDKLPETQVEREHFNIREFVESNKLSPIGAHVWRQGFDRSVNGIREKYGLGKGRVFYRERTEIPLA